MDWKELIAIAAGHGKAQGLTQNEIARRTGAHQKQISQLATGKVEPRLGFALRFFEACGLEVVIKEKQTLTLKYRVMDKFRLILNKIQDCIEMQNGATEGQLRTIWNDLSDAISENERGQNVDTVCPACYGAGVVPGDINGCYHCAGTGKQTEC